MLPMFTLRLGDEQLDLLVDAVILVDAYRFRRGIFSTGIFSATI